MPRSLARAFSESADHVLAVDADRAAGDPAAGPGIAHQRQRDRRLAGAAFADQGDDLAVGDVEADALDDLDTPSGVGRRLDPEVSDLDEIAHALPVADLLRQVVDQQVDADGEAGDGERRHDHGGGAEGQAADVLAHQRAPVGERRLDAEAQEGQAGEQQHDEDEAQAEVGEHRAR